MACAASPRMTMRDEQDTHVFNFGVSSKGHLRAEVMRETIPISLRIIEFSVRIHIGGQRGIEEDCIPGVPTCKVFFDTFHHLALLPCLWICCITVGHDHIKRLAICDLVCHNMPMFSHPWAVSTIPYRYTVC